MPLAIKVDEDLPIAIADMLNAVGYEARRVYDQGMGGWKDPVLWAAIQEEGRFLVTADKGFGDIRIYPPSTHAGVLILRPDEDGIRPVVELTQHVLDNFQFEDLVGTVSVVNPRGIRIRRGPESVGGLED